MWYHNVSYSRIPPPRDEMTPGSQATTNNDAAEAIAMEDLLPILRCIFAFELEPGVSLGESPKSRPAVASTRQVPTNGQRLKSPSAPRISETPVICEQGQDKEHLPTLLGLTLIPCFPVPSRLWPPSLGTVQLCP
jgi:hypothetical protein